MCWRHDPAVARLDLLSLSKAAVFSCLADTYNIIILRIMEHEWNTANALSCPHISCTIPASPTNKSLFSYLPYEIRAFSLLVAVLLSELVREILA